MTETQEQSLEDVLAGFPTRTREHAWVTPGAVDLTPLLGMDGYEQLVAVITGAFPPAPIASTLGMTDFLVERGQVTVRMPAAEFHYNPLGGVHGGVISTLLDTAAACSVHSTLGVGEAYTSLDLTVKFLRPITVDSGLLTCVGKVLQRGRRTALAEAQLFDEQERLLAHATSSCMIFS